MRNALWLFLWVGLSINARANDLEIAKLVNSDAPLSQIQKLLNGGTLVQEPGDTTASLLLRNPLLKQRLAGAVEGETIITGLFHVEGGKAFRLWALRKTSDGTHWEFARGGLYQQLIKAGYAHKDATPLADLVKVLNDPGETGFDEAKAAAYFEKSKNTPVPMYGLTDFGNHTVAFPRLAEGISHVLNQHFATAQAERQNGKNTGSHKGDDDSRGTAKLDPRRVAIVANAISEMGIELQKELMTNSPKENVTISPITLAGVLGALLQGADAAARKQIATVLGLTDKGFDEKELRAIFSSGYKQLREELGGTVALSNDLWTGEKLNPAYEKAMATYFGSKLTPVDFAKKAETLKTINDAVSLATKGMIPQLLKKAPDGPLVVTAASYFEQSWKTTFPAAKKGLFTLGNGEERSVPMMTLRKEELPYFATKDFKMVAVPYKDGKTSMYAIVPTVREGETPDAALARVQGQLTVGKFNEWRSKLAPTQVNVTLPKLKIDHSPGTLTKVLQTKMPEAFAGGAYSGIAPGLQLTDVVMQTVVDIDENGTRAASGAGAFLSRGADSTPWVGIDRPSLFFIAGSPGQERAPILYSGVIRNP